MDNAKQQSSSHGIPADRFEHLSIYYLMGLHQQLLSADASAKAKDLREGSQKAVRELYHGNVFASIYAKSFDLPSMEIECNDALYSDRDIRLRGGPTGAKVIRRFQLTELPPDALNRNRITPQQLIDKKVFRMASSRDVTLAVFINSTGELDTVDMSRLRSLDFWFYGFA